MAGRGTAADGRAPLRRGDEGDEAEMHEDGDFSDLPVHFQPLETDGHAQTNTLQPSLPDSMSHNKPSLMDASTQYFDTSIVMTPTFTPHPHSHPAPGRAETGCQYSPSNDPALYPTPDPLHSTHPMGSAGLYTSSYGSTGHYRDVSNGAVYNTAGSMSGTDSVGVEGHSERRGAGNGGGLYRPPSISCASDMTSGGGYGMTSANGRCDAAVNGAMTPLPGGNDHFSKDACVGFGEQNVSVSGGGLGGEQTAASSSGSHVTGEPKAGSGSGLGSVSEQPTKRYQCPECETSFTRLDHLHRHLKTQRAHFQTTTTEKQYHTCPLCNKVFTRNDHMKRHIKIHARGEPVMCVECQSWFPSKTELTHHLLNAHSVVVFECNLCSKGFFEAMYLTRHLKDKHQLVDSGDGGLKQDPSSKLSSPPPPGIQLPYRCGICSLNFVRELACSKHMLSHTRRDPVDSLALAASHLAEVSEATALAQLQPHLWPNNAPWPTDREGANNSNGQAASAFSPSHPLSEKGYGMVMSSLPLSPGLYPGQDVKAEPCGADGSARPFRQRAEGTGGDNNGRYGGAAGKVFLPCSGDRQPYLCGVCGLGFLRSQELKGHLRTHTGQHRFACVECGANFASSSNLIRHQRTHTGERPFHCSLCSAAFTHKGALVNHERIHTGERPYVCDLCEAAFARVDALTRHKRTHKENRIKEEAEEGSREVFALHA